MTVRQTEETVGTLTVTRDVFIEAPIDVAFEALLEEIGPGGEMPDGTPFPMKIEPWPGGRWYRDLGGNSGHYWAHVQVIKPPLLLELCGPMFMSYPAMNHVQYRLAPEAGGVRLRLIHKAVGMITAEHREGVHQGWEHELKRVVERANRRARK